MEGPAVIDAGCGLCSHADRCEEEKANSGRKKCRSFCKQLYDELGDDKKAPSYLLAAMVDLHADALEYEGGQLSEVEKREELDTAKKVSKRSRFP